ncbi:MAG: cupin-like domain-containing protein, partial [Tateyamaria sp.]
RIFREYEYLDWRDPDIICTIQFDGDLGYAHHLSKSCIRPNDWTIARFHSVERLHARMGYAAISQFDYVHKPTQRALLDIMDAGRPVILTGMETVPANGAWTLDTLVERYGDAIVRVRSATHRQTMAEFVDELKAFQDNPYDDMIEGFVKPYTEGAALPEEMWADFGPPFFGREDFIPPQLWLGAVPTHIPTSSLHRDPRTGFLTQVIGTKRLELYSADQADLVYPMKAYNNYQPCWFKPETPDFGIYPNAARAHSLSVTLHPGEVLVQPAGWFHQVYAMDSPNMSVSYFWLY